MVEREVGEGSLDGGREGGVGVICLVPEPLSSSASSLMSIMLSRLPSSRCRSPPLSRSTDSMLFRCQSVQ